MAQNITLLGANYSAVPAVQLPKTGGGTALFSDTSVTTATPSDVSSGKIFIDASGIQQTGTSSGGGGGLELLSTVSMGTISTSNTTAADTGKTHTVTNAKDYDMLIVITSCTKTNSRHWATVGVIQLYNSSDATNRSTASISTNKYNFKVSNNVVQSRSGTTAYGIYPNSCSISNGNATIVMYQRYNSTSTGTINGTYTSKVYGVKFYNLL